MSVILLLRYIPFVLWGFWTGWLAYKVYKLSEECENVMYVADQAIQHSNKNAAHLKSKLDELKKRVDDTASQDYVNERFIRSFAFIADLQQKQAQQVTINELLRNQSHVEKAN